MSIWMILRGGRSVTAFFLSYSGHVSLGSNASTPIDCSQTERVPKNSVDTANIGTIRRPALGNIGLNLLKGGSIRQREDS